MYVKKIAKGWLIAETMWKQQFSGNLVFNVYLRRNLIREHIKNQTNSFDLWVILTKWQNKEKGRARL